MRINSLAEINEALGALDLFESILLDIRWLRFGLCMDLLFNQVHEHGVVRSNLERIHPVTLRFHLPESFRFESGFNVSMRTKPENVNWGINEVSDLTVLPAEPMHLSDGREDGRFIAVLSMGDNRRITVIFAALEIVHGGSDVPTPALMTTF